MKIGKHINVFLLHHVVLLCSAVLFQPVMSALSNDTDRASLLKFRDAITNSNQIGVLSSWNDSAHFCEWPGISCTDRHQRVTVLDLELLDLHGTISTFIGNLSFLRFINLANNSFSGEIPRQVGGLLRLQHLKLDDNMLEGTIPVNLSHCTKLEILNLGNNKLSGTIPSALTSLPRLSFLNLRVNRLTGGIPPALGNISALTRFSAAYNRLVGNIPSELGRLRKLSIFLVGVNSLSGTIPLSFFNISSLTVITIAGNQFHGTLPINIGHTLPSLQIFYIGGNRFSGLIPESFSNSSKLQTIDINSNGFEGRVPANFGNLPDLTGLFFGNNSLGDYSTRSLDFIDSLTNCTKLQVLDINSNKFGGVLPNSLANLSTGIETLFLGLNQISGSIPGTLENLANLTTLSLRDNLFTGVIPPSLGNFPNLQLMSLASNKLSGEIPSSIGNLTRVFKLYLNNNKFEGTIPRSISGCQSLQYLDISNNALSGAIPEEVFYPLSYLFLDMSRNSFSGGLPPRVGDLKSLSNLNLSENKLNGEIPGAIKGCESLEFLFLQGNSFRGTLSPDLASLKGLQYLDVSRNNLTGEIPAEFEKFRGIMYFNLSFNDLNGEVPNGGIFKNSSLVSVVGNPRLCGGVPELKLKPCPAKKINSKGTSRGLKLSIALVCGVAFSLLIISLVVILWRKRFKSKLSSTISETGFRYKVSYKALYEATNGFSPSLLIGTGSFGSVYKATLGQEEVAVKVLNLRQRGASKSFVAECNALRNTRHRNLVKVLTCCSSLDYSGNEWKALVFEYMRNGSLEKWLHRPMGDQNKGLNLFQRLNIATDVASAIYYLHEECHQPIVHCDVKPSNVLLDHQMKAYLSDFGLARLIYNEAQTSTVGIKGTIGYVAPEYAMGGEPTKEGDVYSYGILILEMFTGRRPTDEVFKDDYNLHNFVKMALPEGLLQIVDSNILTNDDTGDVETDDTELQVKFNSEKSKQIENCLCWVLEIGVSCSEESPNHRINMGDAIKTLQHVRDTYIRCEGQSSK